MTGYSDVILNPGLYHLESSPNKISFFCKIDFPMLSYTMDVMSGQLPFPSDTAITFHIFMSLLEKQKQSSETGNTNKYVLNQVNTMLNLVLYIAKNV